MTKKTMICGRNIFLSGKIFHVGLREVLCERDEWVRVSNNYFQFFHLLL